MVVDWQAMCPEFSISHKAILSPRDFIYTVKYEIGDFMSSGELNVNSNTPVGKMNLVNSLNARDISKHFCAQECLCTRWPHLQHVISLPL